MPEISEELSIGQVAERTGLSVHALRFYEREGILAGDVRRGPGGRRVYTQYDVDWLVRCVILRASGMPLPTIRRYNELLLEGTGNEKERIALLLEHRDTVHAQIARLNECLDLIGFKVGIYQDHLDGTAEHLCVPPSEESLSAESLSHSGELSSPQG